MDLSAIQHYIIDRSLEILNKETLDSYRLRNHNAYTSLIEFRDIVARWNEYKVKNFDTVRLMGEECLEHMKDDVVLSKTSYNYDCFKNEMTKYFNSKSNSNSHSQNARILFCLNNYIAENHEDYINLIYNTINTELGNTSTYSDDQMIPFLDKLDALLSSLFVQLVHEGFSKEHIYLTLLDAKGDFELFWDKLKEMVKLNEFEFVIIWKVDFSGGRNVGELEKIGFHDTYIQEPSPLNDQLNQYYKKYLSNSPGRYFYRDNVKGKDIYAALKKSRNNLMSLFDNIHIGATGHNLCLPKNALVCRQNPDGTYYDRMLPSNYFLDGLYKVDYSSSVDFNNIIRKIYDNDSVDNGAKDRIQSAIRHLNSGDNDTELEQRFINYWIAIEFIFASPNAEESTYTRIKEHLIGVLSSSYVHRNTMYLSKRLVDDSIIDKSYAIWDNVNNIDTIAERSDTSLLYFQKLKQMKSILFTNKDKVKEYYNKHIKNLERHIARIYNTRNALIHEAAIMQDVAGMTSNLRYYLVFLLDQIIEYFSSIETGLEDKVSLDTFFYYYSNKRNEIEKDYNIDTLMQVKVSRRLW